MNYITKQKLIDIASEKLVLLDNQKECLDTIATLINLHLRKLNAIENGTPIDMLPTNSALLIARTGCGKTHIINTLAEAADLNVITLDASAISPEGYKGTTLSQLFWNAKLDCCDNQRLETSIVIIDEFCKLKLKPNESANAQYNLLQVIEGKGINCDIHQGLTEKIETHKMLFIFSGAFDGIEEQIEAGKNSTKKIGFLNPEDDYDKTDLLKNITLEDIKNYGFNRELLGRIGTLLYIPPINKEGYKMLLQAEKGSFKEKYNNLYKYAGVNFEITESACDLIAEKAQKYNSGARAISTILQNALTESFSEIDTDLKIASVILTEENNELTLKYKHKQRERKDKLTKIIAEMSIADADDSNFSHELKSEADIHKLCEQLVSLSAAKKPKDSLLLFYFLQVTVRYLAYERPVSEQSTRSLLKIVETISGTPGPNGLVFDRLVMPSLKNLEETHHCELNSYYILFTNEMNKNGYKTLKPLIENIYINYAKETKGNFKKRKMQPNKVK